MAAVTGQVAGDQPRFDPRGLVELDERVPKTAQIDGDSATFDARELTTRQINLELRRLVYEEGVHEVVIQNPGARHSLGVGILTRCRIRFEGSLGYFACGMNRRARGPHHRPRRLVVVREHDVGRGRDRRQRRLA